MQSRCGGAGAQRQRVELVLDLVEVLGQRLEQRGALVEGQRAQRRGRRRCGRTSSSRRGRARCWRSGRPPRRWRRRAAGCPRRTRRTSVRRRSSRGGGSRGGSFRSSTCDSRCARLFEACNTITDRSVSKSRRARRCSRRHDDGLAERGRPARGVRRDHRPQRPDRAARLDARGLPQDAGPPDRPARALRDHRHAAGGQLDHPRAVAAPQGDPAGQGAGRGRPRALPLLRVRDARHLPRRAHREADRRGAEVLLDLQLPDALLRRRRHHRLAGRRRRDLQPGAAVPYVVRPLRPGDDPDLQGGVLPPAAGLRAADDDDARHRRAAGDGPGVGEPLLVAGADDVRPARRPSRPTPRSRWPGASSATPTTSCASGSST